MCIRDRSVAYTELLDFGGDEIYFKAEPGLDGKTFSDTLTAYAESAVIGIRFNDGRIVLNPPMQTKLTSGDKLIVVSADDDTITLSPQANVAIDKSAIRQAMPHPTVPECTLILGWNERAAMIIHYPRSARIVCTRSPAARTIGSMASWACPAIPLRLGPLSSKAAPFSSRISCP